MEKICKYCFKPFKTFPSKKAIFCSKACAIAWRNKYNIKWNRKRVAKIRLIAKSRNLATEAKHPELKKIRGDAKKLDWAKNRNQIIEGFKKFYREHPEAMKLRSPKICTPERNLKISKTVKAKWDATPVQMLRGRPITMDSVKKQFEYFLNKNDIEHKKNVVLENTRYQYYIPSLNHLLINCGIYEKHGFDKEENWDFENFKIMENDSKKYRFAASNNYNLKLLTEIDVVKLNSVNDILLYSRIPKIEELAQKDFNKNSVLYNALPIF